MHFLLAEVAAYRPDFVVVAGRDVFFATFFAQFDLPSADHTLDGVHDDEVVTSACHPFVGEY